MSKDNFMGIEGEDLDISEDFDIEDIKDIRPSDDRRE